MFDGGFRAAVFHPAEPMTPPEKSPSTYHLERWLVPALIVLFCGLAIWLTTTFERMPPILKRGIQPSDFPRLVCALIIACTAIMVIRDPIRVETPIGAKPLGSLALMVLFVALTQIDFFLALGIFAAALSFYWGERRRTMLLLVGVGVPIAVFFLFDRAFEIRFPKGLLTNLWYG
jgi:hypothetical protein